MGMKDSGKHRKCINECYPVDCLIRKKEVGLLNINLYILSI